MIKSILKWLQISALSLFVSLLALEIIYRLELIDETPVTRPDPILNHVLLPNMDRELIGMEIFGQSKYRLQTNSKSWRSAFDIPLQKDPRALRIFFVGDSFTMGTCPAQNTPSSLVSELLNRDNKSINVEVINTGTPSYSPVLYYLLVKRYILSYRPDIVVINVDLTDIVDDFMYSHCVEFDSNGVPVSCPAGKLWASKHQRVSLGSRARSTLESWIAYLGNYSSFFFAVQQHLDKMSVFAAPTDAGPKLYDWCANDWSSDTQQSVEYSLNMLKETILLLKGIGSEVLVSVVPHRISFEGSCTTRPFEEVAKVAHSSGADFLEVLAPMKKAMDGQSIDSFFLVNDIHYNEKGYQIWSSVFEKYFEEWKQRKLSAIRLPSAPVSQ